MRYCSHCGNALSVGASFCHSCGAPLKVFVPEADESPVAAPAAEEAVAEPVVETVFEEPAAEPVFEEPTPEPVPVVIPVPKDKEIQEEREFLELTHRLLRWERKAWSIAGKVFLILGIIIAALYFLLGLMFIAIDAQGAVAGGLFIYIALILGGALIACGIVGISMAGKIPQFTDTLYKDFRAANKRCNSIGMIVMGYLFNTIAMVFHLINFIRMKCNKALIDRILTRQGVK